MVSRIREFWVIGSGCASQERGVECGSCHTQGVEKGTHLLGPGWRHDMKEKAWIKRQGPAFTAAKS